MFSAGLHRECFRYYKRLQYRHRIKKKKKKWKKAKTKIYKKYNENTRGSLEHFQSDQRDQVIAIIHLYAGYPGNNTNSKTLSLRAVIKLLLQTGKALLCEVE